MVEPFHVSDEDLKRYYMDAMEESNVAVFGEHLLSCQECLDRAEACERDIEELVSLRAGTSLRKN
jgi:hypothetical protein